jgi:8-oxo-dGTP pyrophosphatase MutT (NUDIX family)
VTVRDAATVLVTRDAPDGLEVYLVRRHAKASWLGDVHVFPGGAVDDADRAAAARGSLLCGSAGAVDPAFAITAARESFEESGLLFADRPIAPEPLSAARRAMLEGELTFAQALERFDTRVDASQLRFFSRWITPAGVEPRRFDARFFVARVPRDQIAEADALEVMDGRWMRPLAALAAYERGEIGMIFPTVKHLERIAPFRSVDELLAFAAAKRIATVQPDVTPHGLAVPPELVDAW